MSVEPVIKHLMVKHHDLQEEEEDDGDSVRVAAMAAQQSTSTRYTFTDSRVLHPDTALSNHAHTSHTPAYPGTQMSSGLPSRNQSR